MRLKCPHCNTLASARTSYRLSPLTGHVYYQCSNLDCGHTFKAGFEIVGTITPSAMPNPAIVLPMLKGVGKNYQPLSTTRPFAQVDSLRADQVRRDKEPA